MLSVRELMGIVNLRHPPFGARQSINEFIHVKTLSEVRDGTHSTRQCRTESRCLSTYEAMARTERIHLVIDVVSNQRLRALISTVTNKKTTTVA